MEDHGMSNQTQSTAQYKKIELARKILKGIPNQMI